MAVAFSNNWDIILSKLESLFRTEFKGALKVYSGLQNDMEGNQYLRLSPISSSLVDYSTNLETREFVIGMALYFNEPNIKKSGVDNVMRLVSRIETIIANNNSITLPDNSVAYDCKIESSDIEASDSEYLVQFNFKCTHANSISYPTVAITAAEVVDGASSVDGTLSLTFKTSHTTTDFVTGDVTVAGGSLGSISGSGTTYTATFTPSSGGATTIQVLAGKFTDYSGNKNVASDVFNWTYVEKFVSVWTFSGNDTVTLPLVSGSDGDYNFDIDWGDGGATETITAHDQDEITHSYTGEGTHTKTISIGGTNNTIKGWKFNNTGDKLLITGITNWGTLNISTNSAFYGCTNLNVTATNAPTISTTSLYSCFKSCSTLTGIGGDWDVSNVTDMSDMFQSATAFNGNIADWDTGEVASMSYMFHSATSFNQDISDWDTTSVSNMQYMFFNCNSFNQDLPTVGDSWDVSNVVTMKLMFSGADIFNGNITNWDTSSVARTDGMFQDAPRFNQNIGGWDVSSVADMNNMFASNSSFNQSLNDWNTAAVTNMSQMFYYAGAFNGNIAGWDTGEVTNMSYMFYQADAFNQNIGSWDTAKVIYMNHMFYSANIFNQDIGSWNTAAVTTMVSMFGAAPAFNQDINTIGSSWNTAAVTNMNSVFNGATA